ncbi:hypothetical protein CEP49_01580 [Mergibacter septicus]|uniref:DciA family protein n=1 Tax=Mergibacter septicus TaxID=221402 RepID=UPI001178D46E|nr:DciA family protein [Mergibacter septicus]AWX13327.1 hypothetical protein CEP49_01580 [Mergibacter septicus]
MLKKTQKIKNIRDIMNNSSLANIFEKGLKIVEINQKLSQIIPPEYKYQVHLANIRDDIASLETSNAVIRQALLFQQNTLLLALQKLVPNIKKLEIKINPNFRS